MLLKELGESGKRFGDGTDKRFSRKLVKRPLGDPSRNAGQHQTTIKIQTTLTRAHFDPDRVTTRQPEIAVN